MVKVAFNQKDGFTHYVEFNEDYHSFDSIVYNAEQLKKGNPDLINKITVSYYNENDVLYWYTVI